jgi:hypothetical protein
MYFQISESEISLFWAKSIYENCMQNPETGT